MDTSNIDIEDFVKKKNEKLRDPKTNNTGFFDLHNGQTLMKVPSNYKNEFPSKADLNVDAVVTPENYGETYNINTYHRQHLIGNKEFLSKKVFRNYLGGNSSFKSVPVPPHVNMYLIINYLYIIITINFKKWNF